MIKKSYLSMLIVLIISACADDHEPMIIYDDSYFPLHVGDLWEYRPANEEFPQMNAQIPIVTRDIKGIEVMGGHEYFFMLITYDYSMQDRDTVYDSAYYRLDSNGFVYAFDKKTGTETNPFRLGAIDGDRWEYPTQYGDGKIFVSLVEKFELGNFTVEECKRFSFDVAQMADEENYSVLGPGLGIVSQGNAWGFNTKLKKATIDGHEYEF
jgi:hypothetical protein